MAIFLRQSHNVKPPRWGSFADVQYAVRKNCEKIYDIDSDSLVLAIPCFWGLSPTDYSGQNNYSTNHGLIYKDGGLDSSGITTGGYIQLDNKIVFQDQKPWTFIISVDLDALYSYLGLVGNSLASGAYTRFMGTNTGLINIYNDINTKVDTSSNFCMLRQHMYIFTHRASSVIKCYKDGKYIQTLSLGGIFTFYRLGSLGSIDNYLIDGRIKNINIFDTTLSASQIALFHNLPYGLYQPVSRIFYSIPAGEGWTGKIYGVTNPAKIMGVIVANINKVTGVVSGA